MSALPARAGADRPDQPDRSALGEGVYDVFARKKRGEPLRHVGYVDAPGDALARVYAWKTYDEETWFEMCVVPRSAILPVNRDDGPWGSRGSGREFLQEDPAELPGPTDTPGRDGSGTHGLGASGSEGER